MFEGRAFEGDHIDLDSQVAEVICEGFDKYFVIVVIDEGAVDEVNADDAEGFLLGNCCFVEHTDVDHDIVWEALRG